MPIVGITDRAGLFMEIGRIRKGEEKQGNTPGKNLDHFRVVFRKDEKEAEQAFIAVYGAIPRMINVRIPYPDINRSWDAYYEAHAKGGMVAQATGDVLDGGRWRYYYDSESDQVCVKDYVARNETGEGLVKDGPHLDQPITTNGKNPVFLKMSGKLKIVIPEIGRVGHMTLVTTSIHDIASLSQELQGYSEMARLVNKNICDVPFVLLRRKESITKKIDGKRVKVDDWMVHIIPSGEWTTRAMNTWNRLALEDVVEGETRILPAPVSDDEGWDEEEQEENSGSTQPIHEEHESPLLPPQTPSTEDIKRPYLPAEFKKRLAGMIEKIPAEYEKRGEKLESPEGERKILASIIDTIFGGDKGVSRHIVCGWLIGTGSTKEMSPAQVKGLLHVLGIKGTPSFDSPPIGVSIEEFRMAYKEISKT